MTGAAPRPRFAARTRVPAVVRALRRCGRLHQLGFLWALMTFVVLPGAHTVAHRADHWHGEDGTVHELGETPTLANTANDDVSRAAAPRPAHGSGGALHFGLALTDTEAYAVTPPSLTVHEAERTTPDGRAPGRRVRAPRQTRGPPQG